MTPEQVLSLYATDPTKTTLKLSHLPSTTLATLMKHLNTYPGLVNPLWTYPPAQAQLLSLKPPPSPLISHIQSLSHNSKSLKQTLKHITITATTIFRHHNYVLIPPLLQTLSNLPGITAGKLYHMILLVLLTTAPPNPDLVTPLLDLRYQHDQLKHFINFLMKVLTHSSRSQHSVLLQPILSSSLPLTKPLLYILSNATKATLIAFEACLIDNNTTISYLHNVITKSLFTRSTSLTTQLLHCLFIVLTKSDQVTKDQLINTFERILNPKANISLTPPSEGSSCSNTVSSLFIHAIRNAPEGTEQDLCEFFEFLLWKNRTIGSRLLEEVFIWHPNSRNKILKGIISALSTQTPSKSVQISFVNLFRALVLQPTTSIAMRSCIQVLKESLHYISFMPVGIDIIFIQYLSRVMATIPGTCDQLIMFLRKLSGARSMREQRIAIHGLISVLCVDAGEHLRSDVCDMLVLLTDTDAIQYLLRILLHTIQKNSIPAERIAPILNSIVKHLDVICNNGKMDIRHCFQHYDDYRLPIPLMLRFSIVLQPKRSQFLQNLVMYLCHEQGAIKHACMLEKSPISILERLRLLCDLLETVLGLDVVENENVIRVYGVAVVLRDYLALSSGDDKSKHGAKGKENEYLTMRQAAAGNQQGGSFSDSKDTDLVALLTLRIHALSTVEKMICKFPAFLNIVRSEIMTHVETDVRSLLTLKDLSITSTLIDNLLSLIHKYFTISTPWTSADQSSEEMDTTGSSGRDDGPTSMTDKPLNDDALALVSTLGVDSDGMKNFEESSMSRLQEEARIRLRQTSLRVLCALLSQKLVQNEMAFLVRLTEVTEPEKKTNQVVHQRRRTRESSASSPEKLEDDRILATSRIANLFRREFANSLSIGLTLSYLDLLGHLASKECKRGEDTKHVRELVSNTLTSLLREYSIRHPSVMRSILKLLINTFDPVTGIKFAKSVLIWLGDNPCLLNSKFVDYDDGENLKLGVDEFDRDILEEGIALDAREESEEEEMSDLMNQDNRIGDDTCESDFLDKESPLGEPAIDDIRNSTTQVTGSNNCLESIPRLVSDDADPVMSLCFDETPEVAFLSVTSVLELCERVLGQETQRYHDALKSSSVNVSSISDFVTESVCDVVRVFCETPFMQSFSSKSQVIPVLLLKRLSKIVHRLMEIAQLVLQLLLKTLRNKSRARNTKPHLKAISSILNILYEGDEVIPCVIFHGERRSNRSSLLEGINVSAAELFRYASSKDCEVDKSTQESISALRKVLKSRKNRLPHVHSVKTPWTQSSGSAEPVSGDYFRVSRPQKKQRLRSRNPDVDEWLREEKDGDNYADLEDFVVAMDADDL